MTPTDPVARARGDLRKAMGCICGGAFEIGLHARFDVVCPLCDEGRWPDHVVTFAACMVLLSQFAELAHRMEELEAEIARLRRQNKDVNVEPMSQGEAAVLAGGEQS